jgi:hypothetical protein
MARIIRGTVFAIPFREGSVMNTANRVPTGRRQSDDSNAVSRRVGVIWLGETHTGRYRVPNVVLDISPDGAKLQSDLQLLGQVDRFRLSVQGMAPVDCMPVWQRDGRVGVRFVGGPAPTMAMLDDMVGSPVLTA